MEQAGADTQDVAGIAESGSLVVSSPVEDGLANLPPGIDMTVPRHTMETSYARFESLRESVQNVRASVYKRGIWPLYDSMRSEAGAAHRKENLETR